MVQMHVRCADGDIFRWIESDQQGKISSLLIKFHARKQKTTKLQDRMRIMECQQAELKMQIHGRSRMPVINISTMLLAND